MMSISGSPFQQTISAGNIETWANESGANDSYTAVIKIERVSGLASEQPYQLYIYTGAD
jgi:hypothetical protein